MTQPQHSPDTPLPKRRRLGCVVLLVAVVVFAVGMVSGYFVVGVDPHETLWPGWAYVAWMIPWGAVAAACARIGMYQCDERLLRRDQP